MTETSRGKLINCDSSIFHLYVKSFSQGQKSSWRPDHKWSMRKGYTDKEVRSEEEKNLNVFEKVENLFFKKGLSFYEKLEKLKPFEA